MKFYVLLIKLFQKRCPVADAEARVYVGKALFHCYLSQIQLSGYLYVSLSVRYEKCDLALAHCEQVKR